MCKSLMEDAVRVVTLVMMVFVTAINVSYETDLIHT